MRSLDGPLFGLLDQLKHRLHVWNDGGNHRDADSTIWLLADEVRKPPIVCPTPRQFPEHRRPRRPDQSRTAMRDVSGAKHVSIGKQDLGCDSFFVKDGVSCGRKSYAAVSPPSPPVSSSHLLRETHNCPLCPSRPASLPSIVDARPIDRGGRERDSPGRPTPAVPHGHPQ